MFPNTSGKPWLALTFLTTALFVPQAFGGPISVVNPGFDADAVANGVSTCNGATGFTGWTSLGGGCGTGLLNPDASQYPGGATPSADNVAYLNGNVGYWQALTSPWQSGLTTFGLLVGQRLDVPFGGYTLELRAGATYGASTLLASTSGSTSPGVGAFGPASVSYNASAVDPALGQQILIAFRGQGIQTSFDSVTVDAAGVPEPGTYALLGSALVSLALLRRRRARA